MERSYYAIIPAKVRYDKTITANAKLLYGEITALCNEKGYCWATNKYFAELYGVTTKTISTWINSLTKYIKITMKYKKGTKEIVNRYIQIKGEGIEEIVNTPMEEIVKDNTTVINTTINTKYYKEKINKKETKRKYGEYKHVLLTEKQHSELLAQWGATKLAVSIINLDEYIETTGKSYKNHKLVLTKWDNRSNNKSSSEKQWPTGEHNFTFESREA